MIDNVDGLGKYGSDGGPPGGGGSVVFIINIAKIIWVIQVDPRPGGQLSKSWASLCTFVTEVCVCVADLVRSAHTPHTITTAY